MKITNTNDPLRDKLIVENTELKDKLHRAKKSLEACLNKDDLVEIKKIVEDALEEINCPLKTK